MRLLIFIVNTENIIYCLFMVLSVTICLILGISPFPPLFSFTSSPYLFLPSVSTPSSPLLSPTLNQVSNITYCDWLVLCVWANNWSVHQATISALFVHVCCQVDVSVLCVVLTCEEHPCSLVSFV